MRTSEYVVLDQNVLLEYIYDNDNLLIEDYIINVNTLTSERSFINSKFTNNIETTTNNIEENTLFEIDNSNRIWAPVDTTKYPHLQNLNYENNIPIRYDIVKLHFPINYNFSNFLGFMINIKVLNVEGTEYLDFSRFFFDKSDPTRSLELTAPPFMYNEKLWGKNVTLKIPSPNFVSNQVIANSTNSGLIPIGGSLNENLAGPSSNGVSMDSLIFIDYSFIHRSDIINGDLLYYLKEPFQTTIAQKPEYEDLSVTIDESTNGDYYEVSGTYNGTTTDFESFIERLKLTGNQYYVTYNIVVYEKNMVTHESQYFVSDNFGESVIYRPVIFFSTTTASINVTMELISANNNSKIERKTSKVLTPSTVSKYSRFLKKINVDNAFKPKIYNSNSSEIVYNNNLATNNTKIESVDVPFPQMYRSYNVVAKNVTSSIQDETYYGLGDLVLPLYPYDNIVQIIVATTIENDKVVPLNLPLNSNILLSFKSNKDTVNLNLKTDTNLVDLANGSLVFNIPQDKITVLTNFYNLNNRKFYIISRSPQGSETVIYTGKYTIDN